MGYKQWAMLLGLSVASFLDVRATLAQSSGKSTDAANNDPELDGIIVTATSLVSIGDQSLLGTPRTINALSSELIENIKPSSLQEITSLIPALTPRSSFDDPQPEYYLRGISIAQYTRDGLPARDMFGPIEEIDRLEVLQGVTDVTQGGQKDPSGTVNIVPKHPGPVDFARFTAGVNEYGDLLDQADVNLASADDRYSFRANFGDQRIREADANIGGSRYAIALAFRMMVTSNLILDVNGFYQDQSRNNQPYGFFPLIQGATGLSLPRLSYSTSYGQDWTYDKYRRGVIEAKLAGDLGDGWSILLQSHAVDYKYQAENAFIGSPASPAGSAEIFDSYQNNYIKENAEKFALVKHLAFSSGIENKTVVIADNYSSPLLYNGAFADAGAGNLYLATPVAQPTFVRPPLENANGIYTQGFAIADELTLFDRWVLSAGERHYKLVSKNYDGTGLLTDEDVARSWIPNASALYRVTSDLSLYASYSKGVESGSTVGAQYANAGALLPPLKSNTYELGGKYQLGRVLATLSAYKYIRPTELISNNTVYESGGTRYVGGDASVTGYVTSNLSIIAGLDYIDARTLAAEDPTVVGKVPSNVPKWSSSLFGEYRLFHGLFFSAGVHHVARKPALDDDSLYIPDYTTFDFGGRYETELAQHKTIFRLGATNAFDKFYFAGGVFGLPEYGVPRTIKGSFTIEF